ncbi:hypothetical protein Emag_006164 [Eimeria magna]
MEGATASQPSPLEPAKADELPRGVSNVAENAPVEEAAADAAKIPVEAEPVEMTRQYSKARPFVRVLAVVASAILLALLVRRQMQLDGEVPGQEPAFAPLHEKKLAPIPEVPEGDPEGTPGKLRVKPTWPLARPTGDTKGVPDKPEEATWSPEEKLDKLVEWVRQMPVPEDRIVYSPELEKQTMEEELVSDGMRFTFLARFRILTPAFDPEEVIPSMLEGVPKLVEQCIGEKKDVLKFSRYHNFYQIFGDSKRGAIFVSVTVDNASKKRKHSARE